MMGQSIASFLSGLPAIWKALSALAGAAAIGASAMGFLLSAQVKDNTEALHKLEQAYVSTEDRLTAIEGQVRLTNCLTLAAQTGEDWRVCLEQ